MLAGSHSFSKPSHGPDVLGELLHSLSQPLTGLRCSLELSLDETAEQRHESVAVALHQTEQVIGMVQLMREFLDAEQAEPGAFSTALEPVIRGLVEDLSSIAAVRDVEVRLEGTCAATLPVRAGRLRLALQYLITTVIEAQPAGGRVKVVLTKEPAGTLVRVQSGRNSFLPERGAIDIPATSASTLDRVRQAIASRVFENAGASLEFVEEDDTAIGFILRIPRQTAVGRPY